MNRKPIAILTSDVHFMPSTLALARSAMEKALGFAETLEVPLIDAGDLMDSKAVIRAEVANCLIEILSAAKTPVYLLVGNHTMINEKASDHSMHFLKPYANVVSSPQSIELGGRKIYLIPYQTDSAALQKILDGIPAGSTLIMHQGVQSAYLGHYVQDKSSLPKDSYADFRVISGHYHRAQGIKCGRPRKGAVGLFSYIGNPYSLTYGEANDGPKGFQILYSDGQLEQVPTCLRKHVVIETELSNLNKDLFQNIVPGDLVWIKLKGHQSELAKVDKVALGKKYLGHANYKLDRLPHDLIKETPEMAAIAKLSDLEQLYALIDRTSEASGQKEYLKQLSREILK